LVKKIVHVATHIGTTLPSHCGCENISPRKFSIGPQN
jgi:hypothetical protein